MGGKETLAKFLTEGGDNGRILIGAMTTNWEVDLLIEDL